MDEELLDRNRFGGTRKPKGRADQRPPSEEEMLLLLAGCDALGDYAPRMRALLTFAAHTITRPGELFAFDWDTDIDLLAGEVHVQRRRYRGRLDLPKSNEARMMRSPRPPGMRCWRCPSGTPSCSATGRAAD